MQNKDIADMMITSASRLLSTLDSILQFSRFESGKLEAKVSETYVIEIMESLIHKYKKPIEEKGLSLKFSKIHKDMTSLIDKKLLMLALNNIIDNAIKFTNNGEITFESYKAVYNNKEWTTIEIADTGIGIPPDKLNIIFDEFRQVSEGTTRIYDGNGLGLAIAKKIIEQMHGFIAVESQVGKGSKFTIHLPSAASGNGKSNGNGKSGSELDEYGVKYKTISGELSD
jgi:signal transduction histidine kinase